MKIIQVVPCIYFEAQGPSYSVPRLCESLAAQGATVELHVLSPEPQDPPRGYVRNVHPVSPLLRRLWFSPAMHRALRSAAAQADVLHNNSLWLMPNVYSGTVTRGTRCLLMSSPRGTLSPWALQRSRWLKRALWMLGQSKALRDAACLHATAEGEYRDIRSLGLKAPVSIIPNGVDIPDHVPRSDSGTRLRRLLFLGRIHPTKRVDVLLRAWASLQVRNPEWELEIVGPDNDGYLKEMQLLARTLGCERVRFSGPVYGLDKVRIYQSADLFVLPTHSENFGMAVAEALANGVPAIVSKGAPWAGLQNHGCGWWIDPGDGPLVDCLRHALALPLGDLHVMGLRGREWMEADFSWTRVAGMMLETYTWMVGGGSRPDWVMAD